MDDWTAYFKEMDQLPAPMRKSLLRNSRKLQFPAGSRLFGPGQPAEYLLLLVSGKVRVIDTIRVEAMLGSPGVEMPSGTEALRITLKALARASSTSPVVGTAPR